MAFITLRSREDEGAAGEEELGECCAGWRDT